MAAFDSRLSQIVVRIVYDGPGTAGKTTNLTALQGLFTRNRRGELVTPETTQGRTLYFDHMPLEGGLIAGHRFRCELWTVPGQDVLRHRRDFLLSRADVVVFVVDSRPAGIQDALPLLATLRAPTGGFRRPLVVQANKQDCPEAMPPDEVRRVLELDEQVPLVAAVAHDGQGVRDTTLWAMRLAAMSLQPHVIEHGPEALGTEVELPDEIHRQMRMLPLAVPRAEKYSSDPPAGDEAGWESAEDVEDLSSRPPSMEPAAEVQPAAADDGAVEGSAKRGPQTSEVEAPPAGRPAVDPVLVSAAPTVVPARTAEDGALSSGTLQGQPLPPSPSPTATPEAGSTPVALEAGSTPVALEVGSTPVALKVGSTPVGSGAAEAEVSGSSTDTAASASASSAPVDSATSATVAAEADESAASKDSRDSTPVGSGTSLGSTPVGSLVGSAASSVGSTGALRAEPGSIPVGALRAEPGSTPVGSAEGERAVVGGPLVGLVDEALDDLASEAVDELFNELVADADGAKDKSSRWDGGGSSDPSAAAEGQAAEEQVTEAQAADGHLARVRRAPPPQDRVTHIPGSSADAERLRRRTPSRLQPPPPCGAETVPSARTDSSPQAPYGSGTGRASLIPPGMPVPTLPSAEVRSFNIWPPASGRESLRLVPFDRAEYRPELRQRKGKEDGSGKADTYVYRAGTWCLKTSAQRVYPDEESARAALVQLARRKVGLGDQLPPHTVLVVQESGEGYWLWTVSPWLRSLRFEMTEAEAIHSHAALSASLCSYAQASVAALTALRERQVAMDVHPSNFARVGQQLVYLDDDIGLAVSIPTIGHAWLKRVEEYRSALDAVERYVSELEEQIQTRLSRRDVVALDLEASVAETSVYSELALEARTRLLSALATCA